MKKIHIALVSKETLPVFYMINELEPDRVYLVGTNETIQYMETIEKVAQRKGIVCIQQTTSPNDMQETVDVCERIHESNEGDEFSYNLTGGTKLMAFGALICAQRYKAQVFYTETTSYVDVNEMKRKHLTKMLDTNTIIKLQGQNVKNKQVYQFDPLRTECAKVIRDFVDNNNGAFSTLVSVYQNKINQAKKNKKELEFNEYEDEENGISYRYSDGRIVVRLNGVEAFSSDYEDALMMFFEGRWWETLVADEIAKWKDDDWEMWTNVTFRPNQKTFKDKNEIDILVNIGNTLLFVECKSGFFNQDNIYKLNSVCQTYGSYKSKSCIIEYHENCVNQVLKEKAKDGKIGIIVPNRELSDLPSELDEIINALNP